MAKLPDGTYSIPDFAVRALWDDMVENGRDRVVFYSGGVKTPEDWMAWMKSPNNYPVLVVDAQEKLPVFVAWINSIADRLCFAHFCGIGKARYRPEVGEKVMRYWDGFTDGNGKHFRAILAMIPETNGKAIQLAKGAGFTFLGTIPGLCDLVYENKVVGAMIGYYRPPQED